MKAPTYQQPAPDPGLAVLAQQTQDQKIDAIQQAVSAQTAQQMMTYGTRIAMAGQGMSPLAPSS